MKNSQLAPSVPPRTSISESSPGFIVRYEPQNEPAPGAFGAEYHTGDLAEACGFATGLVNDGRARPNDIVIYQRLPVSVRVSIEDDTLGGIVDASLPEKNRSRR